MNNCNEINVFSKILEKFSMKDNEANNNMIQNINFFEEKQADYDQKRGLKLAIYEGQSLLNQKLVSIQKHVTDMSLKDFSKQKQNLPLARIKRIMKNDKSVRMISCETSLIFSKACELFIIELACRSFIISGQNKRRTIHKSDIKKIINSTDYFDFLLDVVEESYKSCISKYSEEFFAANLDHERLIRSMNFPDFKKVSDGLTAGLNQIILDNNSASGIFQMYMNHYKSFEYKHMKK